MWLSQNTIHPIEDQYADFAARDVLQQEVSYVHAYLTYCQTYHQPCPSYSVKCGSTPSGGDVSTRKMKKSRPLATQTENNTHNIRNNTILVIGVGNNNSNNEWIN